MMMLVRHGQTAFNAAFAESRVDPGVNDPGLTALGRRQARAAATTLAQACAARPILRLLASPYRRTLETADIIARVLCLPIAHEPLLRERAAFACDVGTPRSVLAATWPGIDFGQLDEIWWHRQDVHGVEREESLHRRCDAFCTAMAANGERAVVVCHWGVIRALTGETAANGAVVAYDPSRPQAGG